MLEIKIPPAELWNQSTQEFTYTKEVTLVLEHSLVSISKWEAKWNKPFLSRDPHTVPETIDYIRCMTVNKVSDPSVYALLTKADVEKVRAYIDAPMTATWFPEDNGPKSREIITSEKIYYWMISFNVPSEYEKWHLNRLLTLIKICSIESDPKKHKKMSKKQLAQRNIALNNARRSALNSKG